MNTLKSLTQHITEKLVLNSNSKIRKQQEYNYHPKNSDELIHLVKELIEERGNDADLNDIDTSEITNMSWLFYKSEFNGDISNWEVGKVTNMHGTFYKSKFNGDISSWNVSNVELMSETFSYSEFNGDISDWDVSKVKDMSWLFAFSKFNSDISKWNVNKKCETINVFEDCPIKEEYKPKFNK